MIKHFLTNSVGILYSRILGFIRDVLTAFVLGAGIYSDIFFIAFKLPNLFRRIFAEGAFSQSFIPFYASCQKKATFTLYIFYKLLVWVIVLSLIITLLQDWIAAIIAMGFSNQMRALAAPLIAINFYYLDCIFIVTLFSALLQYKQHFSTTAFSTALLNLSIIIALLVSFHLSHKEVVYYMSYAVVIGGFLQILCHIIALRKLHIWRIFTISPYKAYRKLTTIQDSVKSFNRSFVHTIMGNSTLQLSAFLDTFLASFLASGAISYLYYANRLFQLPMALFSIALSTALFPIIAKMLSNSNHSKAMDNMQRAFYFLLFALSFCAIVGIIFAKPIVWLLFERGSFSKADTTQTALVLVAYLIGLVPFGLAKIFSSWLYAIKQHKKTSKFAYLVLSVNIILSILLVNILQEIGLALASSLSGLLLLIANIYTFGYKKFYGHIFHPLYLSYYILFVALITVLVYCIRLLIQF